MFKFPVLYLVAALCTIVVPPAQAGQRAFVASYGSDTNSCGPVTPCRTFAKAVTVVDPNGEVVVLDSAGYGAVTLTQSISLTAAPGVYAGISVFENDVSGVTINTPGVNVVLRGLAINGQGGFNGIFMGSGKLSIENCVISNLAVGINAGSGAVMRIIKTLVRDNLTGIHLQGEGDGVTADISRSKLLGNNRGISLRNISTAAISDTIVTGGDVGIDVWSGFGPAAGTLHASVIRSTISNHTASGIIASAISGTTSVTLRVSMVTRNTNGFEQSGTATLNSLGNNTITDNGSNTGPLTLLAPM